MKPWNRILSIAGILFFACCLLFQNSTAIGQGRVSTYIVSTAPISYSDISGTGQLLISGAPLIRWSGSFAAGSMPFNFNYDNQTIPAGTPFYWTGGCLGLGSYGAASQSTLGSASYPNQIIFEGGQWCLGDRGLTGYVYQQTTGTAPNRVYTLQVNNYHARCSGVARGLGYSSGSVQIKLYEATGVIDLLYSVHNNPASPCGSSYAWNVGLNGSNSPSFDKLQLESVTGNFPQKDYRLTPPPPPAEFSLQSKSLNYGGVTTGQTLTLTTTLKSLGPNAVIVNSATLTGSSDFTILNPLAPNTSIPVGSQYVFNIKYAPSDAGGDQGTFTVVTNAKDSSTQVVSLNGSGLAPLVQYTFTGIYPYNTLFHHVALHFGDSAKQYIYVQNTGLASLVFNNFTISGLQANMYSVFYTPRNPLPPGAKDSIGIRFQPYLEGRPDAQLAISTNALNQPNDTVSLWGTGKIGHLVITPQEGAIGTGTINGSLMFDSVAIGDSVCKTLTLHNTGTDTLYISRQVVTYGDYDFHYYPLTTPDTMLVPDASKLVNVCFVPISSGGRFANLRFYSNLPRTYPDQRDTSQVLFQIGGTGVPFGKLAVSGMVNDSAIVNTTKCISDTIWNTGSSDLTVTSVKLSGANASDFTVSGITTPMIIARGKYQPVQLCYNPKVRGLSTASLDVIGTTSGRTLTQSLAILGVGQVACMDPAPNPVAFGSTAYPTMTLAKTGSDTTNVLVTNCGDVEMSFTATLTTGTSSDYTVVTATTPMIPAGGKGTIAIAYSPDTLGASTGNVTITPSESSVAAQTLPLTGSGAGVIVVPSGQAPLTSVGRCDTFDVMLQNTGNVAWAPGAATISGSNDFSVVAGSIPASIAANATGTMKVSYCPSGTTATTAQLSFNASTPMALSGVPYQLNGNATSAGVTDRTEQDGFAIGASYPNPTANAASVIVTVPVSAKVTVTLVRVDGSVAMPVYDGMLGAGQRVLSIDAKALASGTYFYVLECGSVRLVREMVVSK